MKKQLFILAIFGLFLTSCNKDDDNTDGSLVGTWLDIGQVYNENPVNSSTKGGIFVLNPDMSYHTYNETAYLGFDSQGKWAFDFESQQVIFESNEEIIPGTEPYQVNNYWIVNGFNDKNLYVIHHRQRDSSEIINPLTNEVIGTIEAIDIKVWRSFERQ